MAVKTYDPKSEIITMGGVPITGYGADTFIEIEYNDDLITERAGCDGAVTRTVSASRIATAKITLQQTSMSNDMLTGLHHADLLSGKGIVPFLMKSPNGTTLAVAAEAYVKKLPAINRGKEAGDVTWTITLAEAEIVVGGIV
jgi:hypothetical protein